MRTPTTTEPTEGSGESPPPGEPYDPRTDPVAQDDAPECDLSSTEGSICESPPPGEPYDPSTDPVTQQDYPPNTTTATVPYAEPSGEPSATVTESPSTGSYELPETGVDSADISIVASAVILAGIVVRWIARPRTT